MIESISKKSLHDESRKWKRKLKKYHKPRNNTTTNAKIEKEKTPCKKLPLLVNNKKKIRSRDKENLKNPRLLFFCESSVWKRRKG